MRRAAKRDTVERDIVTTLRKIGLDVTFVSGEGAPDILVRRCGVVYGFEIKGPKGKRTTAQNTSQWPIIRTADEALRAIGIIR